MIRNNETPQQYQDRIQDEMIAANRRIELNRRAWADVAWLSGKLDIHQEIMKRLIRGELD